MAIIDAPIVPISAPMFSVLATRRRLANGRTTFFEYFFFITNASPLPAGNKSYSSTHFLNNCHHWVLKFAIQSISRPKLAPSWEYVAIPEGSSSYAPAITLGPKDLRATMRDLLRLD